MKVTVITTDSGELVGVQLGQTSELRKQKASSESPVAVAVAGPGQKLHEIEVPDEYEDLDKLEELHKHVKGRKL